MRVGIRTGFGRDVEFQDLTPLSVPLRHPRGLDPECPGDGRGGLPRPRRVRRNAGNDAGRPEPVDDGRGAPPTPRPYLWAHGKLGGMKTTIDLPDELLIAAKKRAAELRCSLRTLIERGLRQELSGQRRTARGTKRRIRWVTVPGGLPPGLDVRDRASMHEWLRRQG